MEAISSTVPCKLSLYCQKVASKRQILQEKVFSSRVWLFAILSSNKGTSYRHLTGQRLLLGNTRSRKAACVCQSNLVKRGGVSDANTSVRIKRLAVFVSGGGSNFRSIHKAIYEGEINGDVTVLVTDKTGCGGEEYARHNGIPVIYFPKTKSSPDGVTVDDLVDALKTYRIDFVLLAGYLKLIPVELVRAFPKSIVNIHPSLLPAFGGKGFYGIKVHQAVIASGARFSGPTIHFVDEHYDTGRILAQRVVPVLANDTPEQLASRVLHEEHQLYVEVVSALCEERIVWREDGVPLIRSRENPDQLS